MSVRRALAVASLLAMTLLAACADAPIGTDPTMCKPPACVPAKNSYAAEVSTVGTLGPPNIEFSDLILDDQSGYFALTMPQAVTVSGSVLADGKPVPSTVVLTRPSRVLGRPDVYYEGAVDLIGAFSISLPPNLTDEQYLVRVQPVDTTQFPPTAITRHIDTDMAIDLKIGSGDQLAVLRGTVKDVVNGPIGLARVTLRDAVTLLDVSTVGTTAADGSFKVRLPYDALALSGSLVLVIARGDDTTGLLSMTIELSPSQVQAQLIDAVLALQIPSLPPTTHYTLHVTGVSSSGTDKPVAGAHVLLRTSLLDGGVLATTRAVHEVEAQTAADGSFDVDLYSNATGSRSYDIAISPTADSEFASGTSTITVGAPSGTSTTIKLQPRAVVTGRVLDPMGMPLKGAVLQPSFSSDALSSNATSLATTSKTASATTDIDGRFSMRLDSGSYELGLLPPASAMLPRRWLPAQMIAGNKDLGDLVAPMAIQFAGVVVDSSAQPLKSVDGFPIQSSVRLYLVPAGNSACDKQATDCLTPPRLQAEGTTDKDGRATLLLAADGT